MQGHGPAQAGASPGQKDAAILQHIWLKHHSPPGKDSDSIRFILEENVELIRAFPLERGVPWLWHTQPQTADSPETPGLVHEAAFEPGRLLFLAGPRAPAVSSRTGEGSGPLGPPASTAAFRASYLHEFRQTAEQSATRGSTIR